VVNRDGTRSAARRALGRRCRVLARLVIAVALATITACSGSSASGDNSDSGNPAHPGWPATLVFAWPGGAPNSTQLANDFAPLAELIKKKLGITVTTYYSTSYAASIEAQKAGKVQLLSYGPFEYIVALNGGLKIEDIGNETLGPGKNDAYYYSYAVVNPKLTPQITSLKDARGKKVCFSDPASTSGYFYPEYGLIKAGISPTTGVTPTFAGTDSLTAIDVAKGVCQIGFSNNLNLPAIFTANHIPHSDIEIIWKSPPIPDGAMGVSDSVPASLRAALEKVLVNEGNAPYLVAHGYCTSSVTACEELLDNYSFTPPGTLNVVALVQPICKVTKNPACKPS
jgi:phosphonate transport system substrate-binding protein